MDRMFRIIGKTERKDLVHYPVYPDDPCEYQNGVALMWHLLQTGSFART